MQTGSRLYIEDYKEEWRAAQDKTANTYVIEIAL